MALGQKRNKLCTGSIKQWSSLKWKLKEIGIQAPADGQCNYASRDNEQ